MLPLRIRKDARDWFSVLRNEEKTFKIDFDSYYFCFIAGIAKRRKELFPNNETVELVQQFPGPYRSRGKLLLALFLKTELEALGVPMNERMKVHSQINRLIAPENPHNLSDEGVREFNKYAHAGFDLLNEEWFAAGKPRSLDSFLRTFKRNLDRLKET